MSAAPLPDVLASPAQQPDRSDLAQRAVYEDGKDWKVYTIRGGRPLPDKLIGYLAGITGRPARLLQTARDTELTQRPRHTEPRNLHVCLFEEKLEQPEKAGDLLLCNDRNK